MNRILLCGYPKTGNTFARFVMFNYLYKREHDIQDTLTYRELIQAQKVSPIVKHTHLPGSGQRVLGKQQNPYRFLRKFKYIIYITRNPFDTMISYWHYLKDRDPPFNILKDKRKVKHLVPTWFDLKEFIKFFLPMYIDHHTSTLHEAEHVLKYEEMIKSKEPFRKVLNLLPHDSIDENAFEWAYTVSSFKNVQAMGRRVNQKGGLAGSLTIEFCRDGRAGQYKEVMNEELIEYIKNECEKGGLEEWIYS